MLKIEELINKAEKQEAIELKIFQNAVIKNLQNYIEPGYVAVTLQRYTDATGKTPTMKKAKK